MTQELDCGVFLDCIFSYERSDVCHVYAGYAYFSLGVNSSIEKIACPKFVLSHPVDSTGLALIYRHVR